MASPIGETFSKINSLMVIVLGLTLTGFYYNFYYNDGSKLELLINNQQSTLKSELEKKKETDRVLSEEAAIQSEVGELGEKFKEITSKFPVNLKSDELVATINVLAKRASVRVVSVRKNATNSKDLYEEVPLNLELQGTFNNLTFFMYSIGILEKVTNIVNFEFNNIQQAYDGNLKLSIRVIGYKYKMPTQARVHSNPPLLDKVISALGIETINPLNRGT